MWGRVEVTDCPGIIAGPAYGACEVNSKYEEEAMSVHIVDDEILPNDLTRSIYSSLTCNFKDLNLSRREGVRIGWLRDVPRGLDPPSVYRAV